MKLNIEAELELCQNLTDGPWEVGGPYPSISVITCVDCGSGGFYGEAPEPPRYEPVAMLDQRTDGKPNGQAHRDAAFIAHARTNYPLALQTLLAIKELCEQYRHLDIPNFGLSNKVLEVIAHIPDGSDHD